MLDAQPMQKPLNYARFVCFTTVFIGDEQKYENEQQQKQPKSIRWLHVNKQKVFVVAVAVSSSFLLSISDLPKVKAFVYAAHRAIDIAWYIMSLRICLLKFMFVQLFFCACYPKYLLRCLIASVASAVLFSCCFGLIVRSRALALSALSYTNTEAAYTFWPLSSREDDISNR